jgi:hypothetical protein
VVLAHAFGERYDLPLPLYLFVFGGAAVVLLSFLLIARRVVAVDPTEAEQPDVTPIRPVQPVLGAIGVVLLIGGILAGVTGVQDVPENILPTWFWLYIWVVVPLSCAVVGDWTQELNPYATLAKVADSDRLRRALLGSPETLKWPRWLGWWPAVLLFFLTASGELIFNLTVIVPRNLAVALAVYAVVSALCGLLFGRAWLERGEMFSVLFATWGRLGFLRFGAPGRRGFAGGLVVPFEPTGSRIAFVLMLLVSVSFDGLLATPSWNRLEGRVPGELVTHAHRLEAFRTLTFISLAVTTCIAFGIFAYAASKVGRFEKGWRGALAVLLPSLLPISFGYLMAHYIQYVVVNGQLILPLLGNPTGQESWPIHLPYPFNDDYEVNTSPLPTWMYWYFAVMLIVAVHVVAVVLAHRHLAREAREPAAAQRSEYPWLAAMVGYTMLSLWLIAQPIIEEHPSQSDEAALHRPPPAVERVHV